MDLLGLLLSPIVWIPVVGILAYATYQNYKKRNRLQVLNVDSVLLMLEIPKDNEKKELSAEQLFASLHGILRDANDLKNSGGVQEHLSFEIASVGNQIRFFVWVPKVLQSFVEGQIYAQYPSVQIYRIKEDYVDRRLNYPVSMSTEIVLTEDEALPIKTFDTFEVDPLAGITGTLAKLNPNGGEELWIAYLYIGWCSGDSDCCKDVCERDFTLAVHYILQTTVGEFYGIVREAISNNCSFVAYLFNIERLGNDSVYCYSCQARFMNVVYVCC